MGLIISNSWAWARVFAGFCGVLSTIGWKNTEFYSLKDIKERVI